MTSQNGNRFGGYSPCYVNRQINGFVKDNTRKSFLFQYNKKEIYEIKNQEEAVQYNYQYGPTYGGHDLGIYSNFLEGYSHLGISYGVSKYKIVDPQEHHFGETIQRQIECKVYKVIF